MYIICVAPLKCSYTTDILTTIINFLFTVILFILSLSLCSKIWMGNPSWVPLHVTGFKISLKSNFMVAINHHIKILLSIFMILPLSITSNLKNSVMLHAALNRFLYIHTIYSQNSNTIINLIIRGNDDVIINDYEWMTDD